MQKGREDVELLINQGGTNFASLIFIILFERRSFSSLSEKTSFENQISFVGRIYEKGVSNARMLIDVFAAASDLLIVNT